jgi:hypothetical protein
MFRDIFRIPARRAVRVDLWMTGKRMREAAKVNSKPFVRGMVLQTLFKGTKEEKAKSGK